MNKTRLLFVVIFTAVFVMIASTDARAQCRQQSFGVQAVFAPQSFSSQGFFAQPVAFSSPIAFSQPFGFAQPVVAFNAPRVQRQVIRQPILRPRAVVQRNIVRGNAGFAPVFAQPIVVGSGGCAAFFN